MEDAILQAKAFWNTSFTVGAVGPLFLPRRLLPWMYVHFWDILFENELGGNLRFHSKKIPQNSQQTPNHVGCRELSMLFLAEIVVVWQ